MTPEQARDRAYWLYGFLIGFIVGIVFTVWSGVFMLHRIAEALS